MFTDQTGLASLPAVNPKCSTNDSTVAFLICCYPNGGIGVCTGGAPAPQDNRVLDCMLKHEEKHIYDLENDVFPCDKKKCSMAVQLYCAVAPGQKNDTECSGSCTELACLNSQGPTPEVLKRKHTVEQLMKTWCRGKGKYGCLAR
jgi:hypothetical protein